MRNIKNAMSAPFLCIPVTVPTEEVVENWLRREVAILLDEFAFDGASDMLQFPATVKLDSCANNLDLEITLIRDSRSDTSERYVNVFSRVRGQETNFLDGSVSLRTGRLAHVSYCWRDVSMGLIYDAGLVESDPEPEFLVGHALANELQEVCEQSFGYVYESNTETTAKFRRSENVLLPKLDSFLQQCCELRSVPLDSIKSHLGRDGTGRF